MRVLVAEGSLLIADRLTKTLQAIPGVEAVTHASNAAGVMRSMDSDQPEIVIADPHLAGSDGIELLRSIKRRSPAVVLIVLSHFVCHVYGRRCLEAGADYFWDKSNDFDRVIELVGQIQRMA